MSFVLTIAGDAKELMANSLSISETANGRTTLALKIKSEDASYRPALDAEVLITEDGDRIFGGLIDKPSESGLCGGARPAIVTAISAVDFQAYTERRFVKATIPAGTMKAALQYLVDTYLDVYGVTLDAGQVTGPTFPELEYDYVAIRDVLDQFATLTASSGQPYVWRIDAFKVLSMAQPSTTAAPFDILTNAPSQVIGDIVVEPSREHYANRVIVQVAQKTETNHLETFTGDGSTNVFPLEWDLLSHRYEVFVDGVRETLDTEGHGFDLAVFWLYDPDDNTIRRVEQDNPNPPPNGSAIEVTFEGTFQAFGDATDASYATNPYEKVVSLQTVPSDTTAQAIAEAELAKSLLIPKTVRYRTLFKGLRPGQSQTVTVPARNVDIDGVITDVNTHDEVNRLVREITVVGGTDTNLGNSWRDVIRGWSDDTRGKGGGVSAGAGVPIGVGPAPPDTSVQYNRNGSFGGHEGFTFLEAATSVLVGLDHQAIGAANLLVGQGHTVN